MTTPLDIARGVYERFGAGDLDGVIDLCSPDIEWVVNGPPDLEKCRAFRGHQGVRQFFEILGRSWEFSSFETREFIAHGGSVVVLGEEAGRDNVKDAAFSNRWAHVFDVRDGQVQRFREFLCCWFGGESPPEMSWGAG